MLQEEEEKNTSEEILELHLEKKYIEKILTSEYFIISLEQRTGNLWLFGFEEWLTVW